jgi:hypothetical protein
MTGAYRGNDDCSQNPTAQGQTDPQKRKAGAGSSSRSPHLSPAEGYWSLGGG